LSGDEQQGAVTVAAAASATLLGYFFVVLVLGRYFADYDTPLRYVIPSAIAAVPASIALGGRFFVRGAAQGRMVPITVYAAITAAALTAFLPSFAQRIAQAREFVTCWRFAIRRSPKSIVRSTRDWCRPSRLRSSAGCKSRFRPERPSSR
jgi:hypothetical protein